MLVAVLVFLAVTEAAADKPPAASPIVGIPPDFSGPAGIRIVEGARARASLASYISMDDYPAAALSRREQGRPQFRLAIGPDGRVTGCVILVSSGSAALDSATCRIMRDRARFTPAHDAGGRPVEDQNWGEIAWRIERN